MSQFDDFRNVISDFGDLSWSIVAVKAGIDETGKLLAQTLNSELLPNATLTARKKYEALGNYIAISQVKECEWVMIYYSLGQYQSFNKYAKAISEKLKTQVLVYEAEDTSGAEGVALFENGSKIINYYTVEQSEYLDDLKDEVSAYDDEMEEDDEEDSYAEKEIVDDYGLVFEQLGIKTVDLYPNENGNVSIEQKNMTLIERVDLIRV